jgi:hypothetical protein
MSAKIKNDLAKSQNAGAGPDSRQAMRTSPLIQSYAEASGVGVEQMLE